MTLEPAADPSITITTGASPTRSEVAAVTPPPEVHLWIEALPDPIVDELGHDPRGGYVERYWLGILGPSTTWLLRHLADGLDHSPGGYAIELAETAAALGLGGRQGRHSPFMRSIDRACQFGLARRFGDGVLAVRRRVPPLTRPQVRRLPEHLQAAHEAAQRDALHHPLDLGDRRARRLALALLEVGDAPDEVERHLSGCDVAPAAVADALRWAQRRHETAVRSLGGDAA